MVQARQCLALQFFKNGQKRYFSRKPDMMESFLIFKFSDSHSAPKMPSEASGVILFTQKESRVVLLELFIYLLSEFLPQQFFHISFQTSRDLGFELTPNNTTHILLDYIYKNSLVRITT